MTAISLRLTKSAMQGEVLENAPRALPHAECHRGKNSIRQLDRRFQIVRRFKITVRARRATHSSGQIYRRNEALTVAMATTAPFVSLPSVYKKEVIKKPLPAVMPGAEFMHNYNLLERAILSGEKAASSVIFSPNVVERWISLNRRQIPEWAELSRHAQLQIIGCGMTALDEENTFAVAFHFDRARIEGRDKMVQYVHIRLGTVCRQRGIKPPAFTIALQAKTARGDRIHAHGDVHSPNLTKADIRAILRQVGGTVEDELDEAQVWIKKRYGHGRYERYMTLHKRKTLAYMRACGDRTKKNTGFSRGAIAIGEHHLKLMGQLMIEVDDIIAEFEEMIASGAI
jgi:hypothetical protein